MVDTTARHTGYVRSIVKKSQLVLLCSGTALLAIIAVAAIAGPGLYRDYLAPPAADAPTLSTAEDMPDMTSGGALTPAGLAGDWTVAPGSEAGYRVDEVLNGTHVTVTGRTDQVSGSFVIDESGLTLTQAELTVDVNSIATDQPQRDNFFRTQALRTTEFPDATFVLTEPVSLDAVPASGEVTTAAATGDLTIAGVTRRVSVNVEVRSDGTTTEIAGAIPIVFDDFGVEAPSLGFVQVDPEGFVEFQLTATR